MTKAPTGAGASSQGLLYYSLRQRLPPQPARLGLVALVALQNPLLDLQEVQGVHQARGLAAPAEVPEDGPPLGSGSVCGGGECHWIVALPVVRAVPHVILYVLLPSLSPVAL